MSQKHDKDPGKNEVLSNEGDLILLQPSLQVSSGVVVVQRSSEMTQGLGFNLIQGPVHVVYFPQELLSFWILRRTLYRD